MVHWEGIIVAQGDCAFLAIGPYEWGVLFHEGHL